MNKKFLRIAKDLIYHSTDKGALAFIFKTKGHAMIIFYVFGSQKITFEDLCKVLDKSMSRSTIQSILIEGVKRNYISKTINVEDKRKKYYDCNKLKPTLQKWFDQNKAILTLFNFKYFNFYYFESSAWAAESLATGTLNGEQET